MCVFRVASWEKLGYLAKITPSFAQNVKYCKYCNLLFLWLIGYLHRPLFIPDFELNLDADYAIEGIEQK